MIKIKKKFISIAKERIAKLNGQGNIVFNSKLTPD
jgi:hypothetical protein